MSLLFGSLQSISVSNKNVVFNKILIKLWRFSVFVNSYFNNWLPHFDVVFNTKIMIIDKDDIFLNYFERKCSIFMRDNSST